MADENETTTNNGRIVLGTLGDDQITAAESDSVVRGAAGNDTLAGSTGQDFLDGDSGNDQLAGGAAEDKLLGGTGDDTLDSGAGNDLAAGDYVSTEWQLVDGKWVYDPGEVRIDPTLPTDASGPGFDDTITTGAGDDVLLGNLGDDTLKSGAGDDIINAGTGNDTAFGGDGDDLINLEQGHDIGYGGRGADVINAGDGNDLVYGDLGNINLLGDVASNGGAVSPNQYANLAGWNVSDEGEYTEISHGLETTAGEAYVVSFDLAANLNAASIGGTVEVLWNGEVVDTVSANTGVYETHSIEVTGQGDAGSLSFRVLDNAEQTGPPIDTSGPIFSYEKSVTVGGEEVTVDAFAPGQAKLYQVIQGQLKVFDTASETYTDAGADAAVKVNAIGFNVEDDLIYGIAKSSGTDALGNAISSTDLVMMDAAGETYRIGDVHYGDYVGDFDDSGNLWTFSSKLNRVTKIDVDNLDANGNPVREEFDIPDDLFGGRIYDIAYNAEEEAFFAIAPPATNGGNGEVVRIDLSNIEDGGVPEISSVEITGSLIDGEMHAGMAKGAYGAVFLDGDGNLYFGLNRGDHDLDGTTDAQGAIYQVHADFQTGQAYAEYKAESESTGSNDGAVDPRSVDPFAETDVDAGLLIREPSIISAAGGNDDLRGGDGNDVMYGEIGADTLNGGTGDDNLDGGVGNDKIIGGTGNDGLAGGEGNDTLLGGTGNDDSYGDAGRDYINAGSGNDFIDGGAGNDKIVGGLGSDTLAGGEGDDHIWGGNWTGDGSSDTFVVSQGGGKDMIHDFEADHDVLDLSAYGLEYSDVEGLMQDQGWATVLDLSGLDGGQGGDKLIVKSVSADDLDESNFSL